MTTQLPAHITALMDKAKAKSVANGFAVRLTRKGTTETGLWHFASAERRDAFMADCRRIGHTVEVA